MLSLPEMQVEGGTFDFWCTLCFKTSTAEVYFLHTLDFTFLNVLCQLTLIFVWRLSEAWYSKRPLLVEAVNSLLDEQSLGVRKALSEVYYKLIAMDIVMALLKDSVLNF